MVSRGALEDTEGAAMPSWCSAFPGEDDVKTSVFSVSPCEN